MSAQPEALCIADECEQSAAEWRNEVDTRMQAAAELRRLHAENKELVADRDSWADQASERLKDWDDLRQICEEKDALLRQAWAVIRWQCFGECRTEGVDGLPTPSEIDAAIRQHLGQKGETQ